MFLLVTRVLLFCYCFVIFRRSSFGDIKSRLWEEARSLPAASELRNSELYVFVGVTKDATERVFDDRAQIVEIDELIAPVVEVSKPVLERDTHRLEQYLRK